MTRRGPWLFVTVDDQRGMALLRGDGARDVNEVLSLKATYSRAGRLLRAPARARRRVESQAAGDCGCRMIRPSRRTRWRAALFRMAGVRLTVRMVMLALAENMGEDGRVSVPLKTMCARLNMAPRRVLAAYADAIDAGLLARVSPGYEGHTAEYQALLPALQRVLDSGTLSDGQSVSKTSTLSASKSGTLSTPERVPESSTPIESATHPARVRDGYVVNRDEERSNEEQDDVWVGTA
jgi:hypothetical protein